MAEVDQNTTWNRLYDSKVASYSLKHRLLIRIFSVLLILLIAGATFTKLMAFSHTRLFLQEQATAQLETWLDISSMMPLKPVHITDKPDQFLMVWQGNQLLINDGTFTLPKPTYHDNFVHTDNGHNWVMAQGCLEYTCVISGIKDTKRKFAVRSLVMSIFITLFVIFLLMIAALSYAVNSALKPVVKLSDHIKDIAPDKLSRLSLAQTPQELKPLVNALNQMIEKFHQQLNRERNFLNTCTHELRTPVAGLMTHIQALDFVDETLKPQLDKIQNSAHRTVRVANQFLSLAKNRNAQTSHERETTFDLCELARRVAADHMDEHNYLNCHMLGVNKLTVTADAMAIEIACRNILENTLKYADKKDNSTITSHIIIQREEHYISMIFEDDGPSVSLEYLHHLKERFYRVPEQDNPGAGLGLSIVEEVAQRYQGEVQLTQGEKLGGLCLKMTLKL